MATVNGLTAEYMLAIEANTIVGAHITGNDLILDQFDGGTINVGSIVGIGVNGTADWPNTNIGEIATGPEGVTTAKPGSIRMKTNGEVWVKVSGIGNTGWAKLTSLNSTQLVYIVCTSGTRPSSPAVGQKIYETDTGKELMYYGATTGWQRTWGDPWGVLNVATTTAASASIAGTETVVSTSPSFDTVTNRMLKVTMMATYAGTVSGDLFNTCIRATNLAGAVISTERMVLPGANNQTTQTMVTYYSGFTTGSRAFAMTLQRTAGTGTAQILNALTCHWIIEDMGSLVSPPSS